MYSKYYYDWKPSHYGIEKRGSDRFVLNFLWLSREIWQLKLEEKRNYDHILWVSEAGKFADSEVVSSSGRISLWFFAKLMNTWKRKYERLGNILANMLIWLQNIFWSATKCHCSNLNDWIRGSDLPVISNKQETMI